MIRLALLEGDVGLEPADGGHELAHVPLACFETFRVELQVGDFVTVTIDVTMSEMPFDSAQAFKQVLSGLLVVVFEPLHALAKDRMRMAIWNQSRTCSRRRRYRFRERGRTSFPTVVDEGKS
ncbi:hypothetical protein CK231_22785 [Mesorhizobium loti]|nr:hypothetical protein CK231_22785 [Mesorhizobium loti]PBC07401.1 hypothetical protein CK230_25650 [Mesorhizobium sp. WSM3859]